MNIKLFVLAIFLIAYILLVLKRGHPFVVLGGAIAALLIPRAISINEAISSINYNVLGVFSGTMILSSLFIFSGVPAYFAPKLVDRSKTVGMAILAVCVL